MGFRTQFQGEIIVTSHLQAHFKTNKKPPNKTHRYFPLPDSNLRKEQYCARSFHSTPPYFLRTFTELSFCSTYENSSAHLTKTEEKILEHWLPTWNSVCMYENDCINTHRRKAEKVRAVWMPVTQDKQELGSFIQNQLFKQC